MDARRRHSIWRLGDQVGHNEMSLKWYLPTTLYYLYLPICEMCTCAEMEREHRISTQFDLDVACTMRAWELLSRFGKPWANFLTLERKKLFAKNRFCFGMTSFQWIASTLVNDGTGTDLWGSLWLIFFLYISLPTVVHRRLSAQYVTRVVSGFPVQHSTICRPFFLSKSLP